MSQSRVAGLPDGAFVWCRFPFGDPVEARGRPGPKPHIVYCIGSRATGQRITEYLVAYTSSGPWRGSSLRPPVGVIDFDTAQAATLNQIAFHLDLRCLARVSPSGMWFPHWLEPHQGIVAVADAQVKRRILDEAARMARHAGEIIDIRGIGDARIVTSSRPRT